ncbi:hypothetical protein ACFL29_01745 [Patescibacteria group bacterium]
MQQDKNKKKQEEKDIDFKDEYVRLLVIERLRSLPKDAVISIGSKGTFNREDAMSEVEEGSDAGKTIMEVQMEFLQSLKTGELYDENIFDYAS